MKFKIGDVCLIIGGNFKELLGKSCVYTGDMTRDNYGHDCLIKLGTPYYGQEEIMAARRLLIKISGKPKKAAKKDKARET